jgi:hypothetical protein
MIKYYFTFKNGQVKKCFSDNPQRKYISRRIAKPEYKYKRQKQYTKQEQFCFCLGVI